MVTSFDTISQDWLIRFLEHRIGDPRIIRLIQKWLKAGILEDGAVTVSEVGTPQGSVISPLLANIYLFYSSTSMPNAGDGARPLVMSSSCDTPTTSLSVSSTKPMRGVSSTCCANGWGNLHWRSILRRPG